MEEPAESSDESDENFARLLSQPTAEVVPQPAKTTPARAASIPSKPSEQPPLQVVPQPAKTTPARAASIRGKPSEQPPLPSSRKRKSPTGSMSDDFDDTPQIKTRSASVSVSTRKRPQPQTQARFEQALAVGAQAVKKALDERSAKATPAVKKTSAVKNTSVATKTSAVSSEDPDFAYTGENLHPRKGQGALHPPGSALVLASTAAAPIPSGPAAVVSGHSGSAVKQFGAMVDGDNYDIYNTAPSQAATSEFEGLLVGLPWHNNSCWLDVLVEGLHTAVAYGASLPAEGRPINVRYRLMVECLALRSQKNSDEVRQRKDALWKQASSERPLEVDPPGTSSLAEFDASFFALSEEDTSRFWTATYQAQCRACGHVERCSAGAHYTRECSEYPVSWRACPKCSTDNAEVTVLQAPVAATLHTPGMFPVADPNPDGTSQSNNNRAPAALLDLFGQKYVLVFTVENVGKYHYKAHVRLGSCWFTYDPGRAEDRRQLREATLPANGADFYMDALYIRADVFDEHSPALDRAISALRARAERRRRLRAAMGVTTHFPRAAQPDADNRPNASTVVQRVGHEVLLSGSVAPAHTRFMLTEVLRLINVFVLCFNACMSRHCLLRLLGSRPRQQHRSFPLVSRCIGAETCVTFTPVSSSLSLRPSGSTTVRGPFWRSFEP